MREPGGAGGRTGHGGDEGARSQGGADGSKDRDGSRAWRLEVETGDPHAWVELEAGSPEAADQSTQLTQTEGELRDWQEPAETE